MSTELDKIQEKVNLFNYPGEFHLRDSFRLGFEAALDLKVLAQVPEVRRLLDALEKTNKYIFCASDNPNHRMDRCKWCKDLMVIDETLSPWKDALKDG